MRISKAWIVAAKDLKIFTKKTAVLRLAILFPLLVSVGLPLILHFAGGKRLANPASVWPQLIDAFSFFYVILAAYLPTSIASYSLVGEKIEKTLEPLLATPTTDGELLLGKSLAGFIPPITAIYVGSIVFMTLIDVLTHGVLGYEYFPNWTMVIILLAVVPLTLIFAIEANVLISARTSDPRSAQLQGSLIVIPFAALYVASEIKLITLTVPHLFIIAAVVLLVDIFLFSLSTKTFQREEILTKWS